MKKLQWILHINVNTRVLIRFWLYLYIWRTQIYFTDWWIVKNLVNYFYWDKSGIYSWPLQIFKMEFNTKNSNVNLKSLARKNVRSMNLILSFRRMSLTAWKVSKYGAISGPYFPVFGLNTEIYSVNLRI